MTSNKESSIILEKKYTFSGLCQIISFLFKMMKEDNQRQDDLIEELNKKIINAYIAEDDAAIDGGSKISYCLLVPYLLIK